MIHLEVVIGTDETLGHEFLPTIGIPQIFQYDTFRISKLDQIPFLQKGSVHNHIFKINHTLTHCVARCLANSSWRM